MNLLEEYERMISRAISTETGGIYPHQALGLDEDGALTVWALDLPPVQVVDNMRNAAASGRFVELVWGLDRNTRDGQGTTLTDVLPVTRWTSTGLALAAADVLAAADDAEQVALDDAASEWVGIRSMAARALAGVEAARAMVSK
jgi:hypothetical protein